MKMGDVALRYVDKDARDLYRVFYAVSRETIRSKPVCI